MTLIIHGTEAQSYAKKKKKHIPLCVSPYVGHVKCLVGKKNSRLQTFRN